MTELTAELSTMSRPCVLVRAARFAAAASLRQPARRRTLQRKPWPKLLEEEALLDTARRGGDAGYSPTRHVEVLTQLLTEAGPKH